MRGRTTRAETSGTAGLPGAGERSGSCVESHPGRDRNLTCAPWATGARRPFAFLALACKSAKTVRSRHARHTHAGSTLRILLNISSLTALVAVGTQLFFMNTFMIFVAGRLALDSFKSRFFCLLD